MTTTPSFKLAKKKMKMNNMGELTINPKPCFARPN
jgi:hypothetical protein